MDFTDTINDGFTEIKPEARSGKTKVGFTWFFPIEFEPTKKDFKELVKNLKEINSIKNGKFIIQLEIAPNTGIYHIHAAINAMKSSRPTVSIMKLFPDCRFHDVHDAEQFKAWQTYCCKSETRAPNIEPVFYNIEKPENYLNKWKVNEKSKEMQEKKLDEKLTRQVTIKLKKKAIEKNLKENDPQFASLKEETKKYKTLKELSKPKPEFVNPTKKYTLQELIQSDDELLKKIIDITMHNTREYYESRRECNNINEKSFLHEEAYLNHYDYLVTKHNKKLNDLENSINCFKSIYNKLSQTIILEINRPEIIKDNKLKQEKLELEQEKLELEQEEERLQKEKKHPHKELTGPAKSLILKLKNGEITAK